MKTFALSAVGVCLANAKSREFVEGKGINGASGQFVRLSDPSTVSMFGSEATDVKYELTSWGVYYEDEGKYAVRLMAELTAPIFPKDEVTFQVNYRVGTILPSTDKATIGEDSVQCVMTRSSTTPWFWSAAVSEGWNACKGSDPTDTCVPTGTDKGYKDESAFYTANTETSSNWATPFADDNWDTPWCTHVNTKTGEVLSAIECTKLRCYMERLLDTSNVLQDFKLTPTVADPDKLIILRGRAKVYINKTDAKFVIPTISDVTATQLELVVPLGAVSLLVSSLASIAVAASLFAF